MFGQVRVAVKGTGRTLIQVNIVIYTIWINNIYWFLKICALFSFSEGIVPREHFLSEMFPFTFYFDCVFVQYICLSIMFVIFFVYSWLPRWMWSTHGKSVIQWIPLSSSCWITTTLNSVAGISPPFEWPLVSGRFSKEFQINVILNLCILNNLHLYILYIILDYVSLYSFF